MRWNLSYLLGLLFLFSFANPMEAQSLFQMIKGYPVPNCVPNRTCDDYCKKPQPRVAAPFASTCDDYCKKPCPCVLGITQFTCDDYCRKPVPSVCQHCPPRHCVNQAANSGSGPHTVWDDLSATTYQDPLGNVHFLQNPLTEPHWAHLSITQPFADRRHPNPINRKYFR